MTEHAKVLHNEQLKGLGLSVGSSHWNLSVAQLVEQSLNRGEAKLASNGALCATTGERTGRSADDKYVVNNNAAHVMNWNKFHRQMEPATFDAIKRKVFEYLGDKEVFVLDAFAGADPEYALPIRVITEYAWHNLFARQMFRRLSAAEVIQHMPEWTVISIPSLKLAPEQDGTRSQVAAMMDFEAKLVLIVGTEYAGEIKKSIFTVMNMVLPERDVMPMHCSANIGGDGSVALFFGLSGTGKTTLSADPARVLIGDDEHGWSDNGVFNFEGGCYAKCIRLTHDNEPEIYDAIRFGSVLENVMFDDQSRLADYDDACLTENTRAAYPLDYIPNASDTGRGGQPSTIIFLTADAFGVLPPISRLNPEQAMYHFLSGYTAKLAGTEAGVGSEPQATFSTCFGAPFMPRDPNVYAELLGRKMREHAVDVFLVNTGWSGGQYGKGDRIKLRYTRKMVSEALNGNLKHVEMRHDSRFNLDVPVAIEGVPSELLDPRSTWSDGAEYDTMADRLAERFQANFKQFEANASADVIAAGPHK